MTYNVEFSSKFSRPISQFFTLSGAPQRQQATRNFSFSQTTQNWRMLNCTEMYSFECLYFPQLLIFLTMKKRKKGGKRKKVFRDRKEIFCCFFLEWSERRDWMKVCGGKKNWDCYRLARLRFKNKRDFVQYKSNEIRHAHKCFLLHQIWFVQSVVQCIWNDAAMHLCIFE